VIGTVPATGQCCYQLTAPTLCEPAGQDTCWNYFCVTAHTGSAGEHFQSQVVYGCSAVNLDMSMRPDDDEADYSGRQELSKGDKVNLEPPEPNPSSEGFVMRLVLGKPDWIDLSVFDVSGRKVAELAGGYTAAGSYTISWMPGTGGGIGQAPGLYFARLVTTAEVRTVKLLLVR
jgi:hypothetical protein